MWSKSLRNYEIISQHKSVNSTKSIDLRLFFVPLSQPSRFPISEYFNILNTWELHVTKPWLWFSGTDRQACFQATWERALSRSSISYTRPEFRHYWQACLLYVNMKKIEGDSIIISTNSSSNIFPIMNCNVTTLNTSDIFNDELLQFFSKIERSYIFKAFLLWNCSFRKWCTDCI